MSCIVYQTNKKTGVKYAYESISYWDKEKQQPRSRRKYLGRVDPETGEIIRSKGKKNSEESAMDSGKDDLAELYEELKRKDQKIADLQSRLDSVQENYEKLQQQVRKIRILISEELADV